MKNLLFLIGLVTIGSFLQNEVHAYHEDVYLDEEYHGSGDESKTPSIGTDYGSGDEPDDYYDIYDDDYDYEGSGFGHLTPVHPDPVVPSAPSKPDQGIYFTDEVVPVQETPQQPMPSNTPAPTLTGTHDEMDSPITILTNKDDDRQVSIFAQPGILAAFIGGAVMGLLCAILLVMFIVYRMRKRDEGSYPLDEPKRVPLTSSYPGKGKEIYA